MREFSKATVAVVGYDRAGDVFKADASKKYGTAADAVARSFNDGAVRHLMPASYIATEKHSRTESVKYTVTGPSVTPSIVLADRAENGALKALEWATNLLGTAGIIGMCAPFVGLAIRIGMPLINPDLPRRMDKIGVAGWLTPFFAGIGAIAAALASKGVSFFGVESSISRREGLLREAIRASNEPTSGPQA
jgi:hypothetical protein